MASSCHLPLSTETSGALGNCKHCGWNSILGDLLCVQVGDCDVIKLITRVFPKFREFPGGFPLSVM